MHMHLYRQTGSKPVIDIFKVSTPALFFLHFVVFRFYLVHCIRIYLFIYFIVCVLVCVCVGVGVGGVGGGGRLLYGTYYCWMDRKIWNEKLIHHVHT